MTKRAIRKDRYHNVVPSLPESLSAMRDFVKHACGEAGMTRRQIYRLRLAIDEACADVIQHGSYARVSVDLHFDAETVDVVIADWTFEFDPDDYKPKQQTWDRRSKRRMGGMGLSIICALARDIRLEVGAPSKLHMTFGRE